MHCQLSYIEIVDVQHLEEHIISRPYTMQMLSQQGQNHDHSVGVAATYSDG